ncbi:MAG: hypothetical protein ACRDSF_16980 [Pseudonocardiaceae bacterium]
MYRTLIQDPQHFTAHRAGPRHLGGPRTGGGFLVGCAVVLTMFGMINIWPDITGQTVPWFP